MPGSARHARVAVGVAMALALAATSPVCAAGASEYPVKAEFIERFTRFIDWPASAFAGSDAPFVLCVVGETPITPYLERVARERRLEDRRVDARRLTATSDLGACHLVFISGSERARLKSILTRLSGRPVLTIADSDGFARAGVLINLLLDEQGEVRFEICSSEVPRSGLKISAQLLRLARLVTAGDGP